MVFAMACSPRLKNAQKPAPAPQKEVADTPPPPPEPPRTITPPPPAPPVHNNDAPAPTAPPQSVTPGKSVTSDLGEGKVLYQANCGKCHDLFEPRALTQAQWNRIIPPMAKKAKIDETTQLKITAFLLSEAKK